MFAVCRFVRACFVMQLTKVNLKSIPSRVQAVAFSASCAHWHCQDSGQRYQAPRESREASIFWRAREQTNLSEDGMNQRRKHQNHLEVHSSAYDLG